MSVQQQYIFNFHLHLIWCAIWEFTRSSWNHNAFAKKMTPAPGMKQVLDKPDSCGQYENYERPEGFPVGKRCNLLKITEITEKTWKKKHTFCTKCNVILWPQKNLVAIAEIILILKKMLIYRDLLTLDCKKNLRRRSASYLTGITNRWKIIQESLMKRW